MDIIRRLWFSLMYLGKPPWDTGISPPELLAFMAAHPPGRALDLGCGSGTNAITLAKAGWQVTGVDFAGKAIRQAIHKAEREGLQIRFLRGDVSRFREENKLFDLVLDIGCFHSLLEKSKKEYAANLRLNLAPGGTYLLYAWTAAEGTEGEGLTSADIDLLCKSPDMRREKEPQRALRLVERQDGSERGRRPSAWFTFTPVENGESGGERQSG